MRLPARSLRASAELPGGASGDVSAVVTYEVTYEVTFPTPPAGPQVVIRWNGEDITNQTRSVSVGKRITLSGQVVNAPAGATIANHQWIIPERRIKDWIYSDAAAYVEPVDVKEISSPKVNFVWVDGGTKQVTYSVTVNGTNYSKTATFNVNRPQYTFKVAPTGTIALDPDSAGGARLHYGNASNATPPGIPGVKFETDPPPPDPNPYLKIAQILTYSRRVKRSGTTSWRWFPTSGLDKFPGNKEDSPDDTVASTDNEINIDESSEAWLMYRPSEADVYVPLKMLTWSWSATALRHGATWVASDLGSPTPAKPADGTDVYEHPIWYQKASPPEGKYELVSP